MPSTRAAADGSSAVGDAPAVPAADAVPAVPTAGRILDAARSSFARRGFDATSLDRLADGLGIRKQTILYHFGSKDGLLEAVVDQVGGTVASTLSLAAERAEPGRPRVRALVDATFRLASQRPELLNLLREVIRVGPPASTRLAERLAPLADQASAWVPLDRLIGAYAMVIGMATEIEVLASLGVAPDLAALRRRRRQLLDYLDG